VQPVGDPRQPFQQARTFAQGKQADMADGLATAGMRALRATHREHRTSLLMNIDAATDADRKRAALVTLTSSCSP
jgi:hypothetical protein